MWIMLNDAFFSIVKKDCGRDELLVRARRPGDIEKVFRNVRVEVGTRSDYAYRARVNKSAVQTAILEEIERINYSNFKDSVADDPLHDAYMAVWQAMAKLQPTAPYSGFRLDYQAPKPKHPGRAKGGRARAAKMTADERSAVARHAANVRWGNLR